MRGQANLVAVGIALLLVTLAATVAVSIAGGALADADREPRERRAATAVAARLVTPSSPLTARRNVVRDDTYGAVDGSTLRRWLRDGVDARVRVGDRTVAATGTPDGGTTVRRLVIVERLGSGTLTPANPKTAVTLPATSPHATVDVSPPARTNVTTIRVGGRIVRHNDSGLAGSHRLDLPDHRPATLAFAANGSLPAGSVTVRYAPVTTTDAVLAVTVDA